MIPVRLLIVSAAALVVVTAMALGGEKVILDTDMVEGFDDGVAMVLLANAPGIDLLGVTTVAGNSWPAEGAAFALRQLEAVGHADIPVFQGTAQPLRPGRLENFDRERALFGIGADRWVGAIGRPDPGDWRSFYAEHYGSQPTLTVGETHAVDFIIDTIRANPGEITVAAIGPATNLALAIRQAPDIVSLVKRVVYMGGAFFQQGNVTPAAEFNWWFDPEAARIAVRAPFKEQVIVGLDVCEKTVFTHDRYQALLAVIGDGAMAGILRGTFIGESFEKSGAFHSYIWDVVTAAIIIDPSLVTEKAVHPVDITTDFGLSYGHSLAYPVTGPQGSQPATIILDVDHDRFWGMLLDGSYWSSPTNSEATPYTAFRPAR